MAVLVCSCMYMAFLREDMRPHVYAILFQLNLYCIFAYCFLKIHFNSILLSVFGFQILWIENCLHFTSPPYVLQDSPVLSSLNLNTLTCRVNKCCRYFLCPSVTNSGLTTNRVHSMKPVLLCQSHLDVEIK
jgi:hypothetical protein